MSYSEIKKAINSNLNVPLNELTAKNVITIEANTTWISPVTGTILVSAISAGGDGGTGTNASGGGGGGAAGNFIIRKAINVTKGQSINCTVGLGNTVFGSYFTLVKGANGYNGSDVNGGGQGGYGSGNPGKRASNPDTSSSAGDIGSGGGGGVAISGQDRIGNDGSSGGNGITVFGIVGSLGGISPKGNGNNPSGGGGAGIPQVFIKTFNGAINDGAGGAGGYPASVNGKNGSLYGAGGGGGAGGRSGITSSGTGGLGGNGVIIIEY